MALREGDIPCVPTMFLIQQISKHVLQDKHGIGREDWVTEMNKANCLSVI